MGTWFRGRIWKGNLGLFNLGGKFGSLNFGHGKGFIPGKPRKFSGILRTLWGGKGSRKRKGFGFGGNPKGGNFLCPQGKPGIFTHGLGFLTRERKPFPNFFFFGNFPIWGILGPSVFTRGAVGIFLGFKTGPFPRKAHFSKEKGLSPRVFQKTRGLFSGEFFRQWVQQGPFGTFPHFLGWLDLPGKRVWVIPRWEIFSNGKPTGRFFYTHWVPTVSGTLFKNGSLRKKGETYLGGETLYLCVCHCVFPRI